MPRSPALFGTLVALAAPFALATPPPAPCVSPPVGKAVPFAVGESLEYDIDSLGATIGGLTLKVLPGKPKEPFLIEARGKTGTFAANFYAVDAVATSILGRTLEDTAYQETATEAGVHRSLDVAFPVVDGRLHVRSTREGNRDDVDLKAPEGTRDLLAALYAVRAMELPDGAEVCLPVFAGRRVWTLRVRVEGRERTRTPAGDFQTIRISGTAVRADAPHVTRAVQFWLGDDASRMPVAACGLVQNKPVCANLKAWDPGRRKIAAAPRR
jgi:hypothetical protein